MTVVAATKKVTRLAQRAIQTPNSETDVAALRASYQLTRPAFCRLLCVSQRKLIDLEQGRGPISPAIGRRLREVQRLHDALAQVIEPDDIGVWLRAANPYLQGFKPLELIERGEIDRIWHLMYVLGSGEPSL